MCLIITNSASYLSQLLFKLFFTVTQPDQSSVNISLFLSLVCVRAHKSKADACPLRSSAQQVDSEDGASLSLSLTRPLVEETPRGAREKERESVWERLRDGQMTQKGDENERNAHCDRTHQTAGEYSGFFLFCPLCSIQTLLVWRAGRGAWLASLKPLIPPQARAHSDTREHTEGDVYSFDRLDSTERNKASAAFTRLQTLTDWVIFIFSHFHSRSASKLESGTESWQHGFVRRASPSRDPVLLEGFRSAQRFLSQLPELLVGLSPHLHLLSHWNLLQ